MIPVPIKSGGSGTKAGPFLTLLLQKLNNYLSNSFYVNLHLTGLISRLAIFPQALLRTYLLDHSLVLQPDVPSLFQVSPLFIIIISINTEKNFYSNMTNQCREVGQFCRSK